jgi:hypothetical protein
MGTDKKPEIDTIRLYEIMDSKIPSSSALGQHLPIPRSNWLSHILHYRWSSADMVSVLSPQDITVTADEVPGLLEDIVSDDILQETLDSQRKQLYYGVTKKGLAAWYAAEHMKDRDAHHALTGE